MRCVSAVLFASALVLASALPCAAMNCEDSCFSTYQCADTGGTDYCQIDKRTCLLQCKLQSKKYYGAIAYSSKDGAFGFSDRWNDRREAERFALQNCSAHGSGCEALVWFYNSCGALAADHDSVGWAHEDAEAQAAKEALEECAKQGGKKCELIVSHCSR